MPAPVDKAPPTFRLLVLPGDGIGVEVTESALRIVEWFMPMLGVDIAIEHGIVGGASIDAYGVPITDEAVDRALAADMVLFGAVGEPRWDNLPIARRPEAGILRLRRELDLFANVRPAFCFDSLVGRSSLRPELVQGLDLVIVREATAGVYFGHPRGEEQLEDGTVRVIDTQAYTTEEIRRVCAFAIDLAKARSGRLCSVDKANVMETGRLWRQVVDAVAAPHPDITLSHMYADNCAMQLVREPKQFDVIVTDNLFGDILSDAAAMLTGSLGMLPSASFGPLIDGRRRALYEPVHGSAPDIAGKGIANPLAAILSLAMALRFSFENTAAAQRLEAAVATVLASGARTADLADKGDVPMSCDQMTQAVIDELDRSVAH
jgi:3-isopropylmalate dehydrogenase